MAWCRQVSTKVRSSLSCISQVHCSHGTLQSSIHASNYRLSWHASSNSSCMPAAKGHMCPACGQHEHQNAASLKEGDRFVSSRHAWLTAASHKLYVWLLFVCHSMCIVACLELPVQVVNQGVHILAKSIVLLHADKVCDQGVCNCCMLALPCRPVCKLCTHGGDGMEPGLQQGWVQAGSHRPARHQGCFFSLA
jgi:hypothetical protein